METKRKKWKCVHFFRKIYLGQKGEAMVSWSRSGNIVGDLSSLYKFHIWVGGKLDFLNDDNLNWIFDVEVFLALELLWSQ